MSIQQASHRTLYPEIEPHRRGKLRVSKIHEIYYEECGNPHGKPVLFVHGGPGSGCEPRQRRFFDPERYRIILFDQRGAGQSTPQACLQENTTWHLLADMEALREHLGIRAWQLFGGSWGSTLSLAYAERYPGRVTEMVLRGISLLRKAEIDWFYQQGASRLFADAWEEYVRPIPEAERGDLLRAYHRRLTSGDAAVQIEAARAFCLWEARTSRLFPDPWETARMVADEVALAVSRIECHYFVNRGFLERETQLIDEVPRIRHIPAVLVQGRYDVICPMESAWLLHRAWPESELRIVPYAGHSVLETDTIHELISVTDRFSEAC